MYEWIYVSDNGEIVLMEMYKYFPLNSGSSPRWEKLPSGYHNYQLKGLHLRYMYCSKLKYINMSSKSGARIDMFSFLLILVLR